MAVVLCLNPRSISLKFDVVEIGSGARRAIDDLRLLAGTIDDIGKETTLEISRENEELLSK
jgi:acetate kinase